MRKWQSRQSNNATYWQSLQIIILGSGEICINLTILSVILIIMKIINTCDAGHTTRTIMSIPNNKGVPRQFECFSCMSLSYEDNWEYLQNMYAKPETFTNRCDEPLVQRNIPTVPCGTVCVTLLEPNVEAGVFLGYKYIRGCEDQVLRHGFNQTALRVHRFIFMDKQCKSLSRSILFNRPRQAASAMSFYGDVQLCTCFGNRCNGMRRNLPSNFTMFLIMVLSMYINDLVNIINIIM